MIGLLWAGGVVAEVILFACNAPLLRRIGPVGLLAAAAAAGVVRWAVLALTTEVWALALAQCLHALTFGAMHLGAMVFIARTVPASSANTAQALFAATTNGLGLGAGLLLAGVLYAAWGADAYWVCAAVSGSGLRRGAGDAEKRPVGGGSVAGGVRLEHEAPVAIGAVDGALALQIEEHARMAERAAAAIARDDRLCDLDDLGRIDGHGPVPRCLSCFHAAI